MARIRIKLFGGLSVTDGDLRIDQFPTRRAAQLLAKVALSRQGAISRDELAEELWPEDFLDATRARLRQELARLRTALGSAADALITDRTWVRIDFEQTEIDFRTFERLLRAAEHENDPDVRLDILRRATAQVDGPLLPEFSLPWVISERLEVKARAAKAYEQIFEAIRSSGDKSAMAEPARRALKFDPTHEPFAVALLEALTSSGDVDGAKAAFAEFKAAKESAGDPRIGSELADLAANLDDDFVVRTRPELPSDQPEFADRFVGRQEELSLLSGWLGPGSPIRLVTLVAPGGMGKTRLATVAMRNQMLQPHEVAFLSVENLEPESILGRVQDVGSHTGLKLLVLDNAESALKATADAVNYFLKANRLAKVLVTSRQRLRVSGEQVFSLSPLQTEVGDDFEALMKLPAVTLLIDRVRMSDPSFEPKPDDLRSLKRLLKHLDGLPLAIELAAARVASLGLAEVSERIGDRFALLHSRRQDIPDRQRSLEAVIEWSYRALSAPAQEALAGMAALPGQFAIQTAEAALLKRGLIDDIEELRESSLLVPIPTSHGVRYRLLDSVRAYALEQLDADEKQEIEKRLAAKMLALLEEVRPKFGTAQEGDVNARLDSEQECLMWACEWGIGHDLILGRRIVRLTMRYWFNGGHPRDSIRLGERLIATDREMPENLQAAITTDIGRAYFLIGELERSEHWYSISMELCRKLESPSMEYYCHLNFGAIAMDRGDHEGMIRHVRKAFDLIAEEPESLYQKSIALGMMGRGAAMLGSVDEGLQHVREALKMRLTQGYTLEIARGYRELAEVHFESGELDKAWENYLVALERCGEHPYHIITLGITRTGLEVALESARIAELPDLFRQARAVMDRLGNELDEIALDRLRVRYRLLVGDLAAAREGARKMMEDAICAENERQLAECVLVAAETVAAMGGDVGALVGSLMASAQMPPSRVRLANRIAPGFEVRIENSLTSLAADVLTRL